ncbi:MAG: class I SAM-dependent methyltransferase [Thermoleophilaceae bacterium]|nr:class I SAM-dependent methyltransferase [Thermoleophilaceae bacterium]
MASGIGIVRRMSDILPDTPAEIAAHYADGVEADRLKNVPIEFMRTLEILQRFLPSTPGVIADIGGGPGTYAVPLAEAGHTVHLFDPIESHVGQAAAGLGEIEGNDSRAAVGEARKVELADASVDAALLLGPLYHLIEPRERHQALREALRILRPGGILLGAGISRFASTYDGIAKGFLADPEFEAIVERDLAEGTHLNPQRNPEWFTTAYFHLPDQLRDDISFAGFYYDQTIAVEGPASWIDPSPWLTDLSRTESLLAAIRRVESEPSILGASAHFIVVAHKPPQ